MTDVLLIGLGLLGQWCLGIAIALVIAGPRLVAVPVRGVGFLVARAEFIGLGCVLGIGATSYLQFVWSWAGGSLGRGCSLTLAVGGIALGLPALWLCQRRIRPAHLDAVPVDAVPVDAVPVDAVPAAESPNLARLCALLVVVLFVFAIIQSLLTPQKFWDERAFYGLKAIVLFEDRTIHGSDLANPDFVQGHPRYPLLIPLAEQHLYALLGRVDDRWSKVVFPMLFLGMVFTLAGVLMRHRSTGQAWLGAVLLATTPVLLPDDYGFLSGQADAPIACLEGVALFYLWDSLGSLKRSSNAASTWRTSLILAAVFTGLAGFTKDEGLSHGMIHSIGFLIALAVGDVTERIARRKQPPLNDDAQSPDVWRVGLFAALILSIIPALLLAPWFVHRRQLPLTGEMNYFGRLSATALWNGLSTLGWSIPHLAWRMFGEATIWGLQWWFVVLTLVMFPKRALRPPQLLLLLALIGQLAALLLAGMIAPVMLEEHIGGSSHRYLMQLAPGALLLAFGQLHDDSGDVLSRR